MFYFKDNFIINEKGNMCYVSKIYMITQVLEQVSGDLTSFWQMMASSRREHVNALINHQLLY